MSPRPTPEGAAFRNPECTELLLLGMPKSKEVRGTGRDYNTQCRHLQIELIRCHYAHMAEGDRPRARAMVTALANADSYPVAYPGAPLSQSESDLVRATRRALREQRRKAGAQAGGQTTEHLR